MENTTRLTRAELLRAQAKGWDDAAAYLIDWLGGNRWSMRAATKLAERANKLRAEAMSMNDDGLICKLPPAGTGDWS